MIKEWIDSYHPANKEQAQQALREIMQEIALAGLERSGFFEKAAFYGGTALRIFYGLNRYSEDLEFSLLKPEADFALGKHIDAIRTEFESLGMHVTVKEKDKTLKNNIDSAFLKADTVWRELVLEDIIPQNGLGQKPNIKIKLEIDTRPPLGFKTEERLLLKPFSFYVKCFSAEDLFAGKMHALLFRKWKTNVKGRDWFDMEWYIKNGMALHISHFLQRAKDSGDYRKDSITKEEFMKLLFNKIDSVSMIRVREDIIRFIPDPSMLEIWSRDYFKDLVQKIIFK
jgi:predicted nucleotidyltransferase component of viral defense system